MVGFCGRKIRVSLLTGMTLLVAGIASCYPGEIDSVGEADLVLTFFDSTADFASVGTYAMPDTIIRISADQGSSAANEMVDAEILAQIEAEFTALGYTRVNVGGAAPDVIVLVSAARTDLDFWYGGDGGTIGGGGPAGDPDTVPGMDPDTRGPRFMLGPSRQVRS